VGEKPPEISPLQYMHVQAFELLRNGMGGIDWAGLPYVVEHLGLEDVPALIDAVHTIKKFNPPKDEE
jgi:hypothetical protein